MLSNFSAPLTPSSDLNYRIDLIDEEVRELIQGGPRDLNFKALFQYDQVHPLTFGMSDESNVFYS